MALASSLLALHCATPIRPSGGPADATPPQLVAAAPAEGATNVAADRLVLTFSERVDETSAARALTVTPAFETRPTVRGRGRTLEVLFPDSLRPQTTYVVTLGRELRDAHDVALEAPITLAFSTGDRLDRGRIAGTVRDPRTNGGAGGVAVFAYRLADSTAARPDPRTTPPDYRTETAADGRFQLDYLRAGPFFVAAVEDQNRNARADAAERFAAPPAPLVEAVEADSAAGSTAAKAAADLDLFVTRLDTVPPAVRSARARSDRRLAVRFDEPVRLPVDPGPGPGQALVLADSASGRALPIAAAWVAPEAPEELMVLAAQPLTAPARLTAAVADSSGNVDDVRVAVAPSAAPDTAVARFEGFLPPGGAADSVFLLRPGAAPGVRFSQPLDSLALRARVAVLGPDGPLPFSAATDDGVSYWLLLDAQPPPPRSFRVEVQEPGGPDTLRTRRSFTFPGPDAVGAVLGRVEAPPGARVLVEAYLADGPPFAALAGPDGRFALRDLPPGEYRLRLVLDRNENGRWDGGSLAPYAPPEPLRWLPEPARVRARWETELESGDLGIGSSDD